MAKPSVDQVKKFDTATDKSTKALVTATNNLNKVLGDLGAQVELVDVLSEEIQVKQGQRDNLDKELGIKVREHEAELALQCRENEEALTTTLLQKSGRADISVDELSTLRNEVEELKESAQSAVETAVASTKRNSEAALSSLKTKLESEHAVQTADLKANISSLEGRVGYLVEQVNTYKQMLDDERQARVTQAEAAARAAEANRTVAAPRS